MLIRKLSDLLVRNSRVFLNQTARYQSKSPTDIYEPDYLDSFQPETPIHDPLIIQIKGYNFHILENFQKHIHKIADVLDIEIDESWGLPPHKLQVQRYKPLSTIVDSEYNLTIFERNVKFVELPAIVSPVLLRIIQEITPEGVTVNVFKTQPEHMEIRYIPDNELISLKQQLTDMGGPRKQK